MSKPDADTEFVKGVAQRMKGQLYRHVVLDYNSNVLGEAYLDGQVVFGVAEVPITRPGVAADFVVFCPNGDRLCSFRLDNLRVNVADTVAIQGAKY